MNLNRKSGFTLLEIIIVIIIVGVLASLALPRFFATVEFSRSSEALNAMSVVRQSIERCYMAAQTYVGCDIGTLDVEDPSNSVGTHFTYLVSGQTAAVYTITATRNVFEGGDGNSRIFVEQDGTGVTRSGTGTFVGIR